MPGAAAARDHLTRARGELPAMIEVALRHPVRPEHAFRMEPGFANIQRTPAGTVLARDRNRRHLRAVRRHRPPAALPTRRQRRLLLRPDAHVNSVPTHIRYRVIRP